MRDVVYKQYDSRWGSLGYPKSPYTMSGSGCGVCSVVHVLIELEKYKNYTPKSIRKYMINQGFATEGHGTLHAGITKTLKYYGLDSEMHATMDSAFSVLGKMKKGTRAGIILFGKGSKGGVTWTSSGHYVAFTDYKVIKGEHWFYMKDSGGRGNTGWFCYERHMKGLIKEIWTVELPGIVPGKYYTVGKTYKVLSGRNVRTGANALKYRKVGYVRKGTTVKCLQTSKNGKWLRIGPYRWVCGVDSTGVHIK